VTEHQIHEAIFEQKPKQEKDERPFWLRLLQSIRPEIKPGKKPYIGVKGKVEF
jgi:hypothetical protein